MPCTKATDALLNAIPASSAPTDISARASSSRGFASTRGNARDRRAIALSASGSVIGCDRRETYDSIAWVSASIPAATIGLDGTSRVRSGSATAMSGIASQLEISILRSRASSVTITNRVTSDPVPAVVAMHARGTRPPGTFSAPSNRVSGPSCAMRMATALATSIALPPPSPITASAPAVAQSRCARSTISIVGSPVTRSCVVTCTPASAIAARTSRAPAVARMNQSDTTNA